MAKPQKGKVNQFKLGKKQAKFDDRTLRFTKYRLVKKLPAVIPPTDDHYSKIPNWPMMGNDQYGDCVLASSGHIIQDWTTYASTPKYPTDSQVISLYLKLSPRDEGLVMLDTLNLWRQSGLWNVDDKIFAYVALDPKDITQAKEAIYLFGNIHIGMSLPDNNTFGPWDAVQGPPNPYNGHAVCLVGYDDKGFWAVSWGQLMHVSWAWYTKYCDESYAILSDDWLTSSGKTIDGFDFETLKTDLNEITGAVTPPPDPQPEPPPTPPTNIGIYIFWAVVGLGVLLLIAKLLNVF